MSTWPPSDTEIAEIQQRIRALKRADRSAEYARLSSEYGVSVKTVRRVIPVGQQGPRKRLQKTKKKFNLWLMMLSFFIIGAFFTLTILAVFYLQDGNVFMVLIVTWQTLAIAVSSYWFQRRKDREDEEDNA